MRPILALLLCVAATSSSAVASAAESAAESIWEPSQGLRLKVGVEWGLAYWCEHGPWGPQNGIGSAMNAGYDGAIRATLELRRWVAVDARTFVAYARAKPDVAGPVALLTVGGFVAARFTLPFKHAHPYVLAGPAAYSTSVSGSGSTPLYGATVFGIAAGIGVEVPLPARFSVGAEYMFHYQIGEKYSDNVNIAGGDPTTFNLYAQVVLW
ncbi:MAG: hypothetical protein JWM53_1718 [bacterium]|nr:hypothetical protein [bacterium]